MATAQSVFYKILQIIDPKTKGSNTLNQVLYQDSSQSLVITAATNANPVQVTAAGHGYVTGDPVYIALCAGNTAPNNTAQVPYWLVTVIDANTFTIPVAGNGAYTGNGLVTKALVGSIHGAVFPRERQLEIYNFARRVMLRNALDLWKDNTDRVKNEIGATIVTKSNLTFAASGADMVAPVPADYIEFVQMIDGASANAKLNSITLTDPKFIQEVLKAIDPQYVQSASRRFVFLMGANFFNPNSLIAAGATYILHYYGLTDFTLSDILANTAVEVIPLPRHGALVEIAQAIAAERSMKEINKLASTLLGKE